ASALQAGHVCLWFWRFRLLKYRGLSFVGHAQSGKALWAPEATGDRLRISCRFIEFRNNPSRLGDGLHGCSDGRAGPASPCCIRRWYAQLLSLSFGQRIVPYGASLVPAKRGVS